jgi:RNA polymerase sigma-70 factor (ECF subfamily)
MAESENDAVLVNRAKGGDLAAFEMLAGRYERRVYSLARRILRQEQDAEDVTQQTFLSVLEHLPDFRAESSFATWLMRIATHAALKIIRKRRGLDTVSLEQTTEPQETCDHVPHPEYIADWRESPERLVERNETRQLIDEALATLDEKHRLVFLLDLSESNVKVRLLRARLQLRERLTQAFGDPDRRWVRNSHHHQQPDASADK